MGPANKRFNRTMVPVVVHERGGGGCTVVRLWSNWLLTDLLELHGLVPRCTLTVMCNKYASTDANNGPSLEEGFTEWTYTPEKEGP